MTTYERALKMLYRLIKSGVEYPEAEYKTVEYYRLQDAERLRQMYDESQSDNKNPSVIKTNF